MSTPRHLPPHGTAAALLGGETLRVSPAEESFLEHALAVPRLSQAQFLRAHVLPRIPQVRRACVRSCLSPLGLASANGGAQAADNQVLDLAYNRRVGRVRSSPSSLAFSHRIRRS